MTALAADLSRSNSLTDLAADPISAEHATLEAEFARLDEISRIYACPVGRILALQAALQRRVRRAAVTRARGRKL
jgi:hypothetical protein